MAAHDAVESVPTIAWNGCPSSVEYANIPVLTPPLLRLRSQNAEGAPRKR